MTVNGTSFAERKTAGRALMQEMLTLVQFQHQGQQVIASIGGFDLVFEVQRLGREGYIYTTMLQRTGAVFAIELSMTVTPLDAIARLEHALSHFGRRIFGIDWLKLASASQPTTRASAKGGTHTQARRVCDDLAASGETDAAQSRKAA